MQKLNRMETLAEARKAVQKHGLSEGLVGRLVHYMTMDNEPFPPSRQVMALDHLTDRVPELALGIRQGRIDFDRLREALRIVERELRH